jgi:hypothetical protein
MTKDKPKPRQAPPRFLHRKSERGYSSEPSEAMPREPEAIDQETQERFTKEAQNRDELLRSVRAPSLAERVAELERAGDVRILAQLRRRVEAGERKARGRVGPTC